MSKFASMFKFKQFSVDQSGCAMKINTDGVLLGALANADHPATILDIGTGTGVIALMLAQKFTDAKVDTVEIDADAAQTAEGNFKVSPFADRLAIYKSSFGNYFDQFPDRKYDLIVSNPPFYIGSLKSPGAKRTLAKHTDFDFFERLIKSISGHLSSNGLGWLIVPTSIFDTVGALADNNGLYPQTIINVQSYPNSQPHRVIICFGFNKASMQISTFTIYKAVGIYSEEYQKLLQPYFIDF
jgi:tRNA1Val (adenine37-N6)-methyltransferase